MADPFVRQVVIAGFGGQGILFAGQLLAYAAVRDGKEVSWLPSYGPEMRGGTANCTVVVSDRRVRSPIVPNPMAAVVMNRPSLDKFEPTLVRGGLLVVNSSLADRRPTRDDITIIELPANEMAEQAGHLRAASIVALGAYVAASGAVAPASVEAALPKVLSEARAEMRDVNVAAFRAGYDFARRALGAGQRGA